MAAAVLKSACWVASCCSPCWPWRSPGGVVVAIGVVTTGVALLALLIVMNLPASPLAGVRNLPYVGRLGRLLELESGTGRVRTLIWEGAVALLQDDPLRAAIGYGPESMAVVYNRHYPAALTQVESRTASPDRSHNETFDALITTGILGLGAHLALFVGALLHGLTSLGMVPDRRSRTCCWAVRRPVARSALACLHCWRDRLRLAGVGLPVGAIAGILAYIAARALFGGARATTLERWQKILLMSLLAAIVAHWIEISVGIAIASTRVYFWAYVALMVCVTRWQPLACREHDHTEIDRRLPRPRKTQKSQSRDRVSPRRGAPWLWRLRPFLLRPSTLEAVAMAVLLSMIVMTLAWDLTGNPDGVTGACANPRAGARRRIRRRRGVAAWSALDGVDASDGHRGDDICPAGGRAFRRQPQVSACWWARSPSASR